MPITRVLFVAIVLLLSACGGDSDDDAAAEAAEPAEAAEAVDDSSAEAVDGCPAEDGEAERRTEFDAPHPLCIDPTRSYTAVLATTLGAITIELDAEAAPNTVNNFVTLSRYGFYEGVTFHRIIEGFMAQGGDPTGTGRGGPGYQFDDELPQAGEYQIGSVAMANAGPNTNGSQFFLVSGDSGVGLPPQFSLFGQITEGLDVLERLQSVPTDSGDRPVEDVVIDAVTIIEN